MLADAKSIATFGLTAYGMRKTGIKSPQYLRAMSIVSALVLAMVAWDAERVHYASHVASIGLGTLAYTQGFLSPKSWCKFNHKSHNSRRLSHKSSHHKSHGSTRRSRRDK